jgi:hypothetical protein
MLSAREHTREKARRSGENAREEAKYYTRRSARWYLSYDVPFPHDEHQYYTDDNADDGTTNCKQITLGVCVLPIEEEA